MYCYISMGTGWLTFTFLSSQILTLERLSKKMSERAYSTCGANCSQRKSRQTGIMSSVMTLNWMPCLSNSLSSGAIWPAVSWGPAHILSLRLLFFLLAPVIIIWNWAEERYKAVVSAGFYKMYIAQCNCATELILTDTVNFNRAYHGGGWGHAKLPKGGHANPLF